MFWHKSRIPLSLSHTHTHAYTLRHIASSHPSGFTSHFQCSLCRKGSNWSNHMIPLLPTLTTPPQESLSYIYLLLSSRALFSSYNFIWISFQVHRLFLLQGWSSILKTGMVWFVHSYIPRAYYCSSRWISERTKQLLCPLCQVLFPCSGILQIVSWQLTSCQLANC